MERTLEWALSSLTIEENDKEYVAETKMEIDGRSPELPLSDKSLAKANYESKKRSTNTQTTPSRFTTLRPRRVSTPIKKGVPCRRLNFDF